MINKDGTINKCIIFFLIALIKYNLQYTLLILKYTFCVITHKQSDKLATIQRIKCHAYNRDGAAFTLSQDLKIVLARRIHSIYDPWIYFIVILNLAELN